MSEKMLTCHVHGELIGIRGNLLWVPSTVTVQKTGVFESVSSVKENRVIIVKAPHEHMPLAYVAANVILLGSFVNKLHLCYTTHL
jgi:hypothetical protein